MARWAKMYWNLIWNSHAFVSFGANLTHFEAKYDIPGLNSQSPRFFPYNTDLVTMRDDVTSVHVDQEYDSVSRIWWVGFGE